MLDKTSTQVGQGSPQLYRGKYFTVEVAGLGRLERKEEKRISKKRGGIRYPEEIGLEVN